MKSQTECFGVSEERVVKREGTELSGSAREVRETHHRHCFIEYEPR